MVVTLQPLCLESQQVDFFILVGRLQLMVRRTVDMSRWLLIPFQYIALSEERVGTR